MVDLKSTNEVNKMAWEVWDPFEDMRNLHSEMEKAFRDFYRMPKNQSQARVREPLADVEENDKEVIAKFELPGVDKKDVKVNVTEDMIDIQANTKNEAEHKDKNMYRCERSYSSFRRAFSLPAKVIPDKAKANLKDGVLQVTMPKEKPQIEEKPKHKQITVD